MASGGWSNGDSRHTNLTVLFAERERAELVLVERNAHFNLA